MKRWLGDQLDVVGRSTKRVTVVLDPEGVADRSELGPFGDTLEASDWFELWKAYESHGRHREPALSPLLIIVHGSAYRETRDIPFGIGQKAQVVRLRIPVPGEFRDVVLDLPDDLSDAVVRVLEAPGDDPVGAILAAVWGVALPSRKGSPATELDCVARLRLHGSVPASMWDLLRPRLHSPLAVALAENPPNPKPLQDAWDDWLTQGASSSWSSLFEDVGPGIISLFSLGLLEPAPRSATGLPVWVALGVRETSTEERLGLLLEASPEYGSALTFSDWIRLAQWWAQVRSVLAESDSVDAELRDRAWQEWESLDATFGPWLQANLGSMMLSSGAWPVTVDKVAGVLARRLRQGDAGRVLLLVLDGLGIHNWQSLRRFLPVCGVETQGVFAMVPTLTPVSRQALFAGQLPYTFGKDIRATNLDEKRWQEFWKREGLSGQAVAFLHASGATLAGLPVFTDLPEARAVGIVVMAVDEVLHSAQLMGDRQVAVSLEAWARGGFLQSLVESALSAGFEVWITSDHGNLEALPLGKVYEGLAVESAGLRVRWYANAVLREAARADGIMWDPPGLPEGECYPLFARGRGGYFGVGTRVTHGGLSIDELVVPLVRLWR